MTFNAPSEKFEQDTGFIEINECKTRASEGVVRAQVTGSITIFTQDDKMPYGFFIKKISQANPETKKPIYFFDIDQNIVSSPAREQNKSERRTGFLFLYSAQYDPNQGELTSLDLGE